MHKLQRTFTAADEKVDVLFPAAPDYPGRSETATHFTSATLEATALTTAPAAAATNA
jgi:hypothetical protein